MRLTLFVVTCAFIVSSCSRLNEEELFQTAQTAYQQNNAQEALEKLQELVERFPGGNHAEAARFFIARVYSVDLHDFQKAISAYCKYRELFPDSVRASTALFSIGFIYNNELHQYDSAKAVYEQFLALYPGHEMAASAKFELETLGKNPDELLKPEVTAKEQPRQKVADRTASARKKKK